MVNLFIHFNVEKLNRENPRTIYQIGGRKRTRKVKGKYYSELWSATCNMWRKTCQNRKLMVILAI